MISYTYTVTDEQRQRLENDFVYHAPNESQIPRYEEIRRRAKDFAEFLMTVCPPSRELSLSLTSLEDCVMRANRAIALNE
jgi:hypothetical protein